VHSILLQDWTTLKGEANTSIIQSEESWIDTAYLQDLVFWLDVRGLPATNVLITYETSPRKENALFMPTVGSVSMTSAGDSGVIRATPVLAQDALVPPGRWTRWRVSATDAWAVTFRLFVSANWVGPRYG
jgi:hypothetical protein